MAASENVNEAFGRYLLKRRFARGGMAEIFLAHQEGPAGFSRELVIKRILPELADDPSFVEMFFDEAKLAAQMAHPNIVPIYDFGQVAESYFIAMELISGPSLRDLGRVCAKNRLRLPFKILAKICSAVAEGLAYAHQFTDPEGVALHVVHRDISPSNVVLTKDGIPKILDFGIAKAANSNHRTRTGEIKGKIAYMSPEQILGEPLDGRADVYALGVILYQLVANRRPYVHQSEYALMGKICEGEPPPPRQFNADVPQELERIILTAIAADVDLRYGSAREMCADLERFVLSHGGPVSYFDIAEQLRWLEQKTGEPLNNLGMLVSGSSLSVIEGQVTDQLPDLDLYQPEPTQSETVAPAAEASNHASVDVPTTTSRSLVSSGSSGRSGKVGLALVVALAGLLVAAVLLRGELGGVLGLQSATGEPKAKPVVHDAVHDAAISVVPGPAAPDSAGLQRPDAAVVLDAAPASAVQKGIEPPKKKKKRKGMLLVKTEPWTEIYLGKEKLGVTPIQLELPVGQHQLLLKNLEKQIQKKVKVRVRAGTTSRVNLDLRPGVVLVLVKPWGKVYVDGQLRGVSPIDPLKLAPGSHVIDVVNSKINKRAQRTVKVKAGETEEVRIDLTKL